jgi:hypothetical protein
MSRDSLVGIAIGYEGECPRDQILVVATFLAIFMPTFSRIR